MRVLLIGGSKSGKSSLAQELVLRLSDGSRTIYWAAMEPVDDEDDARIARHVEERAGLGFETVECGRNISSSAEKALGSSVLFDSVTALLANEMFAEGSIDTEAGAKAAEELIVLSNSAQNFVCVCDDIFCDGAVYDELTERYRFSLALVLRRLAQEFEAVCEVVCGMPITVKGELPIGPAVDL